MAKTADDSSMNKPTTLTGNDLATATTACALALAWWKSVNPSTKWGQDQMAELSVLSTKLQRLSETAYPNVRYDEDEGFNCADYGDEPVMRLDRRVLAATVRLGLTQS